MTKTTLSKSDVYKKRHLSKFAYGIQRRKAQTKHRKI